LEQEDAASFMREPVRAGTFSERLALASPRLSEAARSILSYLEQHPTMLLASSAMDIAKKLATSDATVIRSIQALGYDGLPHLKAEVAAALDAGIRTPVEKVSVTINEVDQAKRSLLSISISAYSETLALLEKSEIDSDVARATRTLNEARRIALYGAGPLFPLMQQTAMHLNRIGRRTLLLGGAGGAFADSLIQLEQGDALLVLAYGKVQREGILAEREVRKLGGTIVVITDNPTGRLAGLASQIIVVPRTEVGNMTMYGTVLLVLESMVLGLTALNRDAALSTSMRLRDLREELTLGFIVAPRLGNGQGIGSRKASDQRSPSSKTKKQKS